MEGRIQQITACRQISPCRRPVVNAWQLEGPGQVKNLARTKRFKLWPAIRVPGLRTPPHRWGAAVSRQANATFRRAIDRTRRSPNEHMPHSASRQTKTTHDRYRTTRFTTILSGQMFLNRPIKSRARPRQCGTPSTQTANQHRRERTRQWGANRNQRRSTTCTGSDPGAPRTVHERLKGPIPRVSLLRTRNQHGQASGAGHLIFASRQHNPTKPGIVRMQPPRAGKSV